jgi:mono/diheme cytochrome c family protein
MSYQNPDSNDLDRIHSAVVREKADLPAGTESAPVWVIFLGFIAAALAGTQVTGVAKTFTLDSQTYHAPLVDPRPAIEGEGAALDPFALAMKKGSGTYALCGGCHMADGKGQPGVYPPLAGSEWVTGGTDRLARVVFHGLIGPVTAAGVTVNNPAGMPAQGAALGDQEIANVLTYVRNSFGNTGTMVTKEMVAAGREASKAQTKQWTAAELEAYASKNLPGDVPAGPGATAAAAPAAK